MKFFRIKHIPKTHTKQTRKKGSFSILPLTCFAVAAGFVIAGIFVPKYLLTLKTESQMDVIQTAPKDYYLASDTAMAKNASQQLSSLDRIKLISGAWTSSVSQCSTTEGFLTESEAVNLAKQQLNNLYEERVYPYSLSSGYGNWYSWTTELYKYTDTVFNTYTAYLWVVRFSKFDSSLTHTILMTESGTIINAEVNRTYNNCASIIYAYMDSNIQAVMGDSKITVSQQTRRNTAPLIDSITYVSVDLTDADFLNSYDITLNLNGESERYTIYQYNTADSYGVGIIPAN